MPNEFLSTGASSIDRLLDGGLERGSLSSIHADPDTGKSWLTLQLAAMCNRAEEDGGFDAPALIIDTEGFYSEKVLKKLLNFFKKRWDFPEMQVDVIQTRNIESLYELFGLRPHISIVGLKMQASVEALNTPIKDGRKIIGYLDYLEGSQIWKMVEDKGYEFIAIDGISMPLKARAFPNSLSWLAGRAALLTPFMNTVNDLTIRKGIVIFVTHHLTKSDVTKQESGWGHPWGGDIVRYVQKRMLLMMRPLKAQRESFGQRAKRLHLYRLPGEEQKTIVVDLAKDTGFVDALPSGGRKVKG